MSQDNRFAATRKLYELDGVTHLNIYSDSMQKLGRDLSNFGFSPFRHPDHGVFNSVEGYWYWLSRQDDRLRAVYGVEAKQLGRSLKKVVTYSDEEFQGFVKDALTAKLESHPHILRQLEQMRLPLTHYYVMGPERRIIFPDDSLWIIDHFDKMRQDANPDVVYDKFVIPSEYRPKTEKVVAKATTPQMGLF